MPSVCCRAGYTCLWALAAGGRLGVGSDPRYNKTRCFDPFPFPTPTELQQSRICALAESLDAHRKRQQAQHPDLTTTGMYNVLEKLRSGAKLSATEQKIREHGLVSVLKQIHDDIDAAVSDAYGWPYDLSDEQILERLVALNAERAAEERRGLVRWLRPEFQNLSGVQGMPRRPRSLAPRSAKRPPSQRPPRRSSGRPSCPRRSHWCGTSSRRGDASWSIEEVASQFKGARRDTVESVLDSLAALGLLVAYGTNGTRRWKVPARAAA